jgi:integrase
VTLGAYATDWLRHTSLTVRPNTTAFYHHALNHLEPLAGLPLSALTPAHVREIIATETASGLSPRTVRGVVQTLALVLRRAQEDGHVDRNVAALVRLPAVDTKEPRRFTAAQARRFLDASATDPLIALFAIALGTGLRRGELLALTWRDVDLAHGLLSVTRSKTSAGVRVVPLAEFARRAMEGLERSPGSIWPYRPEYVTNHFRALCARAGVPYITFHGLRHTAASLMLDAGVDPLTIQGIMGHSRVSMTGHYARAGDELRRDAVERLGRAVG